MEAPEMAQPRLLDMAATYAEHGWHVFPCNRQKKPLTEHGWQDASLEPAQILKWWNQWPDAAIGIACGPSGLVVIDHDPRHDPDGEGKQRLFDLIGTTGTRQAQTGSGGRHWYFRAPDGVTIRNSAGKVAPGVDVRGVGGYVIAPPSANEDGSYRWLNRAKLAPLPAGFINVLTDRPAVRPALDIGQGIIPEGQRNAKLMELAGALQRRGSAPLAIEAALIAENLAHCIPPLPEDEVRQIARNVRRYASADPLTIPAPAAPDPCAELINDDAVQVGVTLANQVAARFLFSEMEKDRRELAAHLTLDFYGSGEPYQQRINLESSAQRTELRRELDNLYGKDYGWGRAINSVWTLARQTFLAQDRSARLRDIPALLTQRELISPLMPAEGMTIVFGDGSSSKSYLTLMLAIAGVTGRAAAGRYEVPESNVLYVDYEDSDTNFRRRAERVLAGLGLNAGDADGLHYWRARGIPLKDQWDAIRRACDQHDIGWIIVDSVAPACGGPPEEAQSAVGYHMALCRIGRPCISIAHITKSGGEESKNKPFGTTFWHNLARRTWYVHRVQEEESDVMQVALYCRKVNDGPKPKPLGFEVRFDGDSGPVTFQPYDISREPELVQQTSNKNRIWSVLDGPMSVDQIAEATGLDKGTIRTTLNRYKDSFTHGGGASRGHTENLWTRRPSSADDEPYR